jgi:hypothetical protein
MNIVDYDDINNAEILDKIKYVTITEIKNQQEIML